MRWLGSKNVNMRNMTSNEYVYAVCNVDPEDGCIYRDWKDDKNNTMTEHMKWVRSCRGYPHDDRPMTLLDKRQLKLVCSGQRCTAKPLHDSLKPEE